MKILEQMRRNTLAIISLAVALTALGYNTWRNEHTELNRNIREAGFEMLIHIGELQRIAYIAQWDAGELGGNLREGWVAVFVLQDLAQLMPEAATMRAGALRTVWNQHSECLGVRKDDPAWEDCDDDVGEEGSPERAIEAIDGALDDLREDIIAALHSLD